MVLPGERFVLFSSVTTEPGAERIEAAPLDGGPRSVVVDRAAQPIWSPTGHLLFTRDGAVLAAAFDPATAAVRDRAVRVFPPGAIDGSPSGLGLGVSSSGTLVYTPTGWSDTQALSVDRTGAAQALDVPPGPFQRRRMSPDSRRILVERLDGLIEILDLARGTATRLTTAALGTRNATWNSDGTRVVFRRVELPFWVATDGTGDSRLVPHGTVYDFPASQGPDPDSVLSVRIRPDTNADVFLLSLTGAVEPRPLIVTPAYDGGAQLSPDRRWLLHQSDKSGRFEIYVRRYPALDREWPVSAGGGVQPQWSRDGREIYYRSSTHMVGVSIDPSGAEPLIGTPVPLFADSYSLAQGTSIPI